MPRKTIGLYSDALESAAAHTDRLVIEISPDYMACLVKSAHTGCIEAFEFFELDTGLNDWSDVFYEVKLVSQLLNRNYDDIHFYYNFEESVMVPAGQLNNAAAESFLSLVYGESKRHDIRYEKIAACPDIVNVYRIRKTIHELARKHFHLYQVHHSYTRVVDNLFARHHEDTPLLHLQFYSSHLILAVVKERKLQLIRSIHADAAAGIFYHLVHTLQQLQLDAGETRVEVSGMLETTSDIYLKLQQLFPNLFFETPDPGTVSEQVSNALAAHYCTPFFKLAV